MIRRLSTFLLTMVALVPVESIVCSAQSRTPLTRHVRDVTLNGQAKLVGRLPANQSMRIVLVLPLRNQAALDSLLRDLYDPTSPSFRRFLTVEEFTSRFGPTQADYDAVINFAQNKGLQVAATSRNRLNLDVTGPVASIEQALHVAMDVYQHPTENRTFYAPDREPTPDLSVPLWHIAGLDNYSIPKPAYVRSNVVANSGAHPNATTGSCPEASFCGSDMRAAYYGQTTLTGAEQSLGLLEYVGTDLADLTTYYTNAGQTLSVPITLISTDGTSTSCLAADGCDDTEQTIDMTQALGMAPGLSGLYMYVGSSDTAIFNSMATNTPLNAQLSSSWTWYPADPTQLDPYFLEFEAQGQNYFQASGDGGKWTAGAEIWPADNQYATAVGGTDLNTASAGGPWASETAWSDGGGGISPNRIPIPDWQLGAAAGCTGCSQTYRNGPDVSANANFTFYVCADQTTCSANLYGGTSFAAPMWAGFLALANEVSVHRTGQTLGFINPTLYAIGLSPSYDSDFHDITSGGNGYSATTGYDLATGWGSPNGPNLISAIVTGSTAPGFMVYPSPNAVKVVRGNSGTTTIASLVSNGFDSSITLTASGQPAGVTVGFSPGTITGTGTSIMSITVASSTAIGTFPITVTGTSGSTIESTTVILTVDGTGTFTLSASPASITVAKGSSGTSKITAAISGGFDSPISLSASGEGSIGVSFAPGTIAAPGAGSSTMTVKANSLAQLGTHTVTITGTGGGVTQTTTVTVTVTK
ncbi:MAG: protease pro-enzyme activation domain-containing protein [Bryobacteraceae bacterium]|jgi:kumamolisin